MGEGTCYARFANYPGMASLKVGLSATIGTLACIDQEMQNGQRKRILSPGGPSAGS